MVSVGYACAYAPLPLLAASGLEPHRLLITSGHPEVAGQWLHDNMCPHVKLLLDRALAEDLPDLAGMLLVNSCDAMRRLADAWSLTRHCHFSEGQLRTRLEAFCEMLAGS